MEKHLETILTKENIEAMDILALKDYRVAFGNKAFVKNNKKVTSFSVWYKEEKKLMGVSSTSMLTKAFAITFICSKEFDRGFEKGKKTIQTKFEELLKM